MTRLLLAEIVLAYAAEGADKIVGQILERYAVVLFGIVNITAYVAYIFFHYISPFFLHVSLRGRARLVKRRSHKD